MDRAGIVLCGGKSSRMGLPKAWLPFGPECMLQRVVRILEPVVRPIIVVAAPGQDVPSLPETVAIVRDPQGGRGPLEGLLAGLRALPSHIEAAYATSCDVPFLLPAFAARVLELLGDFDIAVPRTDGFHHPLAAAYRPTTVPHIEALLAAERFRPVYLFDRVRTRELSADELLNVDPGLQSLRNLNHPSDYLTALADAGFEPPAETIGRNTPETSGGGH